MTVHIRQRARFTEATPFNHTTPLSQAHVEPGQPQLQIRQVALASLKPPPRKARKYSSKHLAQIEASIRQRGFLVPIIVDEEMGIVCGVARYLAAKTIKLQTVPVIPIGHLTPDQLRAFRIADNKLAEGGEWDLPELAIELSELLLSDELEIELTGFSTVEIDSILLGSDKPGSQSETEEIEEPDETPAISRVGDVWIIGEHRLICGDAREPSVYERLMDGELARAIFADFPYNVAIAGNVSGLGRVKHDEFLMASGEMSRCEFVAFLSGIMAQLVAFSMPGSIHFGCMDWRHQLEMMQAGEANYSALKNLLIWVKSNASLGTFYRSQYELVYAWKVGKAPHVNNFGLGETGRYRTNVLEYPGCNTFRKGRKEDLEAHSTVKPTPLVADLIRDVTHPGEIVLDPCTGSGTTILAAERTKRRARCIELDPKYVDVTIRRCAARLGLEAVHEETGLTFDALAEERTGAVSTNIEEEQEA